MTGKGRKKDHTRKIYEDHLRSFGWKKSTGSLWRDPVEPRYTYALRTARDVQSRRLEEVRRVMTD